MDAIMGPRERSDADNEAKDRWESATLEEKAAKDPERLLKEEFPDNRVIVLKGHENLLNIDKAVMKLELASSFTYSRVDSYTEACNSWTIIAKDKATAEEVKAEIKAEARKALQAKDAEFEARDAASHAILVEEYNDRPRDPLAAESETYDITGRWILDSPDLLAQWPDWSDKCVMTIYQQPGKEKRTVQLWGEFKMVCSQGILRFSAEEVTDDGTALEASAGSKRKREDGDVGGKADDADGQKNIREDEDEQDEDNEYGPPPPSFAIPLDKLPSATRPKLPFRWRGTDTGTGEITMDSEDLRGSYVTFKGPGGMECDGIFASGFTAPAAFTGRKVKKGVRKMRKVKVEWKRMEYGDGYGYEVY